MLTRTLHGEGRTFIHTHSLLLNVCLTHCAAVLERAFKSWETHTTNYVSFFTRLCNYWKSSEVNCYASVNCKDIFAELQNLVIFCFAEFLYSSRTVSANFLNRRIQRMFCRITQVSMLYELYENWWPLNCKIWWQNSCRITFYIQSV